MNRKDPKDQDFLDQLETTYSQLTGRTEVPDRINDLTYRVIGAAIEVHRHLGPGFPEIAYEEALAIELGIRGIPFRRQQPVSLLYKEQVVWNGQIDLVIDGSLVVELKAVESLQPVHRAQLHAYLQANGVPLGLLFNFNVPNMREGIHRVIAKR